MIIISRKKAIDIEEIVDEFSNGIKADIARMLLLSKVDKDRLEEIRAFIKNKYPNIHTQGKKCVDSVIHEVKTMLDHRLKNKNAQP